MKVDFNIGKAKYEIKDVTISDHYAIQTELALNDKPGFFIVNLLSGCPIEDLKLLSMENWSELWNATQTFLIDQNQKKSTFKSVIVLNNVEYGIVNMNKMSIGEFADLDMILSSTDAERRIHEALAVLYRPVTKKKGISYEIAPYLEDDYLDRAELFKSIPISDAKRAIGFFLLSAIQSTRATLDSLTGMKDLAKEMPEIIETILQTDRNLNELGTLLSSLYQIQIPLTSIEPQTLESEQLLTGSLTEKTKSESPRQRMKNFLRNIKQKDNK
jgi:predicted transcriptional regulator